MTRQRYKSGTQKNVLFLTALAYFLSGGNVNYNGTSKLRPPMGLPKCGLNYKVVLYLGFISYIKLSFGTD